MAQGHLFKKGQEIELVIKDFAFGGVGIAKVPTEQGEFAVFVENTIPGQVVRAQVTKSAKRHAECRLIEILKPSPLEVKVPYQAIPGAPYITLPIEEQIRLKRKTTVELYRRIGQVENIDSILEEYISSPQQFHYRNKMEYSFSAIRFDLEDHQEYDDFALGFKHRGTWWMVENLDRESGMFDTDLENKMATIRQWCLNTGLPAWHPPRREGFFRYLVARKSLLHDQLLINLVTSDQGLDQFNGQAFMQFMRDQLGDRLAGLIHTINPDVGDRVDPLNGETRLLFGALTIQEKIHDLHFDISMKSFFQTNPRSAELLYARVLDYVNSVAEKGVIMDLFCGTGTITQLLAKWSGQRVIGVDIVESAIEDARKNAAKNSISEIDFYASDVGKFLLEYPDYQGQLNTIVLDPPRGGIAPKTLRKIIGLDAQHIVYVSCNPATQSRDTLDLVAAGYMLKRLTLVDQFPNTAHIEAIALYSKKP